jgi:hypothetical protein
MALPSVGGGYQNTDGNQSEQTIGAQAAPQTATCHRNVDRRASYRRSVGGRPDHYGRDPDTLPTAALRSTQLMTNMKANSTFGLTDNQSLAPVPASLRSLLAPALLRLVTSLSQLRAARLALVARQSSLFRKTGDAAYSVYRVA